VTVEEENPLLATIVDRRPVERRPSSLSFAFYGRVSTDDLRGLQDARVSRGWQIGRANEVIRGEGEITREFFDEGISRQVPFLRRPQAAELLRIIQEGEADFHAVVIGEAKRIFSGSQLEDVYYLLQRNRIELWIPELGGKYDDNNFTHKMLLSMEGVMGKVESDTVRARVRDAMTSIAKSEDARWLGGNAPFGYKLAVLSQVEAHTGAQGARGKGYTQTLALHETNAPAVRTIFTAFLDGKSLREICSLLEADAIATPTGRAKWTIGTLSTILSNQTYTGYRVYGKQRKVQVPYDEDDPRLGTVTAKTRLGAPPVLSKTPVYPAIVTKAEFIRANTLRQAKRTLTAPRKSAAERNKSSQPLRGRVFYDDTKMTLDRTRHGKVRYRSNGSGGTTRVAVYDEEVTQAVHEWLATKLSRRNLPTLVRQLRTAAPQVEGKLTKLLREQQSKRTQASNLLQLVEDGDPTAIDRYRLRLAEAEELGQRILSVRAENLDVEGVTELLKSLSEGTRKKILDRAAPKHLNALYDALGLRVDFLPEEHSIRINLTPKGVSGASNGASPDGANGSVPLVSTGQAAPTGVGAKVGAPGGALTLVPTQALLSEVVALPTRRAA